MDQSTSKHHHYSTHLDIVCELTKALQTARNWKRVTLEEGVEKHTTKS